MKRLVSILLVSLLVYNMVGYSVVYWLGGNVALDAPQNESEMPLRQEYITVKVPVSLPYQTNWTAPQPVQGKLQVGNEFYEMVEQIMLNDTLYITCKPDRDARANFFALAEHINKHIHDHATDGPQPSKSMANQLLKEYISFQQLHVFYVVEWLSDAAPLQKNTLSLLFRSHCVVSPPPELA
ncbi:hypothetical protein [Runella salmonicolor]|uniref:Uncharacterized protein n=1 Tax=Runella salmonicolor TaxID=2950278 RepID=A0ABT1FQW6_9BACT|nr:hypothetical protein [Runella salmonicolor]MCP1383870.1 hypothetical protein [Runella salmonicolor]